MTLTRHGLDIVVSHLPPGTNGLALIKCCLAERGTHAHRGAGNLHNDLQRLPEGDAVGAQRTYSAGTLGDTDNFR